MLWKNAIANNFATISQESVWCSHDLFFVTLIHFPRDICCANEAPRWTSKHFFPGSR